MKLQNSEVCEPDFCHFVYDFFTNFIESYDTLTILPVFVYL